MKNKRNSTYTFLVLLVALALYGYNYLMGGDTNTSSSSDYDGVSDIAITTDLLPTSTTGVIVKHDNYSLSYFEKHEQAEWVAYELLPNHLSKTRRKRPYFVRDQKIKTKSAHYKAYKNSGYDKGHLCPAGDRRFSKEAHDETFLTSNISPQNHDFNAGVWNRLEQKTRYWAAKYNGVYVVTGGILKNGLPQIGLDKVSVPEQYYKILYDASNQKAIAFLIPAKESDKALYKFVTSIDRIEALTHIDFFPTLPDEIEDKLEASSSYKKWSFN